MSRYNTTTESELLNTHFVCFSPVFSIFYWFWAVKVCIVLGWLNTRIETFIAFLKFFKIYISFLWNTLLEFILISMFPIRSRNPSAGPSILRTQNRPQPKAQQRRTRSKSPKYVTWMLIVLSIRLIRSSLHILIGFDQHCFINHFLLSVF